MPYITEERQLALLDGNAPETPKNAGELNFVLTMVVIDYCLVNGLSYQTFNDVRGALQECSAEFRQRVVVPYEGVKAAINGDVYQPLIRELQRVLQAQVDEATGEPDESGT